MNGKTLLQRKQIVGAFLACEPRSYLGIRAKQDALPLPPCLSVVRALPILQPAEGL